MRPAARTATTISRPSSRRRRRWPDHLAEQLALAIADPRQRLIGQYLIDLVDETGYLTGDLADGRGKARRAAGGGRGGAGDAAESSIRPAYARATCAECLTIQLKERDRFDPAMQALVAHLDLLGEARLRGAEKTLRRRRRRFRRHDREIRALDPKPGLAFGSTLMQPVVPDVFVRQGADGDWIVELNSDTLPKVLVSQTYYAEVSKIAKNERRQDLSRGLPAIRELAGARARSARQDDSESVDRDRAPAGRVPRCTACSISSRSISRPSPTRSACTSRRCRASPPTNTWRPAAACSS